MKTKNVVLAWMLATAVVALGQPSLMGTDTLETKISNSASKSGKRLPVLAPHEGTGPRCYPGMVCQ